MRKLTYIDPRDLSYAKGYIRAKGLGEFNPKADDACKQLDRLMLKGFCCGDEHELEEQIMCVLLVEVLVHQKDWTIYPHPRAVYMIEIERPWYDNDLISFKAWDLVRSWSQRNRFSFMIDGIQKYYIDRHQVAIKDGLRKGDATIFMKNECDVLRHQMSLQLREPILLYSPTILKDFDNFAFSNLHLGVEEKVVEDQAYLLLGELFRLYFDGEWRLTGNGYRCFFKSFNRLYEELQHVGDFKKFLASDKSFEFFVVDLVNDLSRKHGLKPSANSLFEDIVKNKYGVGRKTPYLTSA